MRVTKPRMMHGGRNMWKTPRPKPFEPDGLTLGANVTWLTLRGRSVGWQVWAQGPGTGPTANTLWWIVNGRDYQLVHRDDLVVVGQCVDAPLFAVAS